MIDPKFTKAASSVMTLQSETNTLKAVQNNSLLYTLCDRDNTGDNKGHYFMSFNLPTIDTDLGTGSTVSLLYPELQQLNVDQIIIAPIPGSSYSEFIDGRSITWKIPLYTGGTQTTLTSITIYSSTYSSDKILRNETSPLLGDNIVYLFSNSINQPYSGYTRDEIGQLTSRAANTTWEPDTTNYLRRPPAVSYKEVLGVAYASRDRRTNGRYSVNVFTDYPGGIPAYNYDIPIGFAVLDKGFLVLTHTGITANFPWSSGFAYSTNAAISASAALSAKTNVYFTGSTNGSDKASLLTFNDVNTSFKQTAVCLAMPKEFYISNNATWNREKALSELNQQTGIVNIDPLYVTEVGLFNALGELIAVSKLSEPVEKNYTNVITFNIDIEL